MPDLKSILGFAEQNPLAAAGLLLIGLSGWQSFVVLRRLTESGYKFPGVVAMWPMIVTMPLAYLRLKHRSQRAWSAWPAYLIWFFAVGGVASLVAGLFQLAG